MKTADLPETVAELKQLVLSLAEENKLLKERLYGRKSEKRSREEETQARLFNEAEANQGDDQKINQEKPPEKTKVNSYERNKPGRKKLPQDLPRKEIIHDLPEEEKQCACGHRMSQIGSVKTEKLTIIPEQAIVETHIRYKYACRHCEGASDETRGAVKIAPAPPSLIPKSIATPGLLAYIITRKYVDGIPLYRLEKIFERIGIDLSRAAMCNWVIKLQSRLNRLVKLLFSETRDGPLVGIDETIVQVLNEAGKSAISKSYMWVARLVKGEKKAVFFRYRPTRKAAFTKRLLRNYRGVVQTDDFTGYKYLDDENNIIHAGCWAHVRRKFFDLLKSSSKGKIANIGLNIIGKLYAIEAIAREENLSPAELSKLRKEKSTPIVAEFKAFLDEKATKTPPKSPLGKAVFYAVNNWPKLLRFLDNGEIPIDNNLVENAIRPFVIGRKNWLFSDTAKGARASATLYTLIESAKLNGQEPYWYLRAVFEKLPESKTDKDLLKLMPWNLKIQPVN